MQALLSMSSVLRNLQLDLGVLELSAASLAPLLPEEGWARERLLDYCAHWHAEPSQGRFDEDALLGEPVHRFLLEPSAVPPWSREWATALIDAHGAARCLELLELAEQLDVAGLADTLGVLLRQRASAAPRAFCEAARLPYDLTPEQAQARIQ